MQKLFKKNIFISHSSDNAAIAEQLGAFLKNNGIPNDRIFCSSVLGQGVNNGEKLNDAVLKAIKSAKVIIYILSQDFISSEYCIEELGVGWYLSSGKQTNCFFLRLPDMELSELHGFVNSKIDKFSLLNNNGDLTLFVENICKSMKINLRKPSEISNNITSFLSAINDECENLIERKTKTEKTETERLQRVAVLEGELAANAKSIGDYKNKLQAEKEQKKKAELFFELEILDASIGSLAFSSCISSSNIKKIDNKTFWFGFIQRYAEVLDKLGIKSYSYKMERLIAQVYLAYDEIENGYLHFKNAIDNCEYVPFYDIKGFSDNYPLSLSEIISILKEKMRKDNDRVSKDLTKHCLQELEDREAKIVEVPE